MVCIFVVWLHIKAHVSRSVANRALQGIQLILSTMLHLVQASLALSGIHVQLPDITIPKDVRTAYGTYSVDPEIIRTACCPRCFTLYSQPIPWKCQWKESPRSRACNTELWTTQNTQKGPKSIPKCLYSTQSFDSWLHFFLSRQVVEDNLEKTFQQRLDHPVAFGANMHDIQDSPAWRDLYGGFQSSRNLVFGIYIDWFNPFSNKMAGMLNQSIMSTISLTIHLGKQVSCGAIVLYCLNLPPHLRYRPENTFIVGLTPSPRAPNATTICHLLDPFIASIAKYSLPQGQQVATFYQTNGTSVQVKVAPLVSDLEASRKVSGFLDHAAIMFCSFCLCTHDEIEHLDLNNWQLRNGIHVRQQANEWLHKTTKVAREALQKESGVRWSPFFHLAYWDPVRHVVLGFMHNWLEGILQHHLRTLWAIGRDQKEAQKVKNIDDDEIFSESDIFESESELEDLIEENASYARRSESMDTDQTTSLPPISHSPSPNRSGTASSGTATPRHQIQENPYPHYLDSIDSDSDDNDTVDLDYMPTDPIPFNFSDAQLTAIHHCIRDITLPTWVQRPPINLGQPGHGKLKAREYLTLFATIFPLIIPEFWYTSEASALEQKHFNCFYHLVSATNIVVSFCTSNASADAYTQHYTQYRSAIQELFPDHPSKPNHHYAMHNAALLKYWGPLAAFSEFPGERMNGMLQEIKTNNQMRRLYIQLLLMYNILIIL